MVLILKRLLNNLWKKASDGGEWSALLPGRFTPGERSFPHPMDSLAYSSTLKMKAVRSCETPLSFYQTASRHAAEDSTDRVYTPRGWVSGEKQGQLLLLHC
jgi:hypothetical protein